MSRKQCDATVPTRSPACSEPEPVRLIYLDESVRAGRYLLAASETDAPGAAQVRRALGDIVLSGQRRLHFKSESAARRRVILGAIVELPVSVTVLTCRGLGEAASRRLLLGALTRIIQSDIRESTLFIERVDGSVALDQSAITSARQPDPVLTWHHLAPHEDPALWVSDAVAWAVGAGGDWRRRIEPVVRDVIEISP